jgi:site-specific DNA-methyltransferase (adenine-specific)
MTVMPSPQHLVIGDARALPEIEDASVHLVVTAPPHWRQDEPGTEGSIGGGDYPAYQDDLERVWRECSRVLLPGCRLCIVAADQFERAGQRGRHKVIAVQAGIVRRVEAIGLEFHGGIVWQKSAGASPSAPRPIMGSYPHPRSGVVKFDHEHVLLFRKPGAAPAVTREAKERAAMGLDEWKTCFSGLWLVPAARTHAAFAPFPVEIPRRLIRMFSFEGERVLDPFAGSGTTLLAAHELGREGIGIDIDPRAEAAVRERLFAGGDLLFDRADLRVTVRERGREGLSAKAAAVEAPKPDAGGSGAARAADPIIRRAERARAGNGGVRDRLEVVLGPNRFATRAGRHVILLGTAPRPGKLRDAAARLEEILGDRPFLLTNRERADLADGDERAYVHLLDRTFVNARLIRLGLLRADRDDPHHPHHAKFLREEREG